MELLYHIGVWSREQISLYLIWSKIYGISILTILFFVIIIINLLSCKCWLLGSLFPDTSSNLLRLLQTLFWDCCLYLVRNNLRVNIMGDTLEIESAVIISNHQSLADHILFAYLARLTNSLHLKHNKISHASYFLTLPRINFFTWFSIWQIPSFLTLLNMGKCDENWELESNLTKNFFLNVSATKFPEWLIIFPEVNIFTDKNLDIQNLQSKKFFLPQFDRVLYPRFSALYNTLQGISLGKTQKFTRLYDITICYKKTPSLIDLFASNRQIEVNIYIKKRLLTKIPCKRNKLEKYLEYTWIEKDKLLSRMSTLPEITNVVDYTVSKSPKVRNIQPHPSGLNDNANTSEILTNAT